jgi:hypothetical protein
MRGWIQRRPHRQRQRHRDYREIRTYVQAANKARMATDGMARTLAMFPAAKAESST